MEILRDKGIRALRRPDCPQCGVGGRALYVDLVDQLFGVEGHWSLRRCASSECGLIWLDPMPDPEELPKLYRHYHTHGGSGEGTPMQRALRFGVGAPLLGYPVASLDRGEQLLAGIFRLVGPMREAARHALMWLPQKRRGRLLDLGCGAGSFLVLMQRLGWHVEGIEPDPTAAAAAQQALGSAQRIEGSLDAAAWPAESFDAVTLSHVLEHLPEPLETLRACRRLLKPGGWLVVTTPNARSLGARRFGRHWRGWEPPRHLQIYDPTSLQRVAERAGLSLRRLQTVSAAATFLWSGSRALVLASGDSASTPAAPPRSPGWDGVRALSFWALEYLRTRFGEDCGEELLLVAERPVDANGAPR